MIEGSGLLTLRRLGALGRGLDGNQAFDDATQSESFSFFDIKSFSLDVLERTAAL